MSTALTVAVLLLCTGGADHFEVEAARPYRVGDLATSVTLRAVDEAGAPAEGFCGTATVEGLAREVGGQRVPVGEVGPFRAGELVLHDVYPAETVTVSSGELRGVGRVEQRTIPGWLSILPPLIAIALAVAVRQAMLALFVGIWLGATFIYGYDPFTALLRVFDTHLVAAVVGNDAYTGVADAGHASILLFTMALGGMVGILARSGGTRALVDLISRRAKTRRSGLIATWVSGLVVFFDDYANCLLVGNTMRPFTDRLRISREKLAYIVDSTAAPVTTVALVSTWIGYQLGLFEDLAAEAGTTPYDLFLDLLPYSFYSWFTLAFVLMLAITARDYGPMLRAERRAVRGQVLRPGARPLMDKEITDMVAPEGTRPLASLALVPIASVILIVMVGLYVTGSAQAEEGASLREIIEASDSYAVLLWAGFGGSLIAAALSLGTGTLNVSETVDAWIAGVKAMVIACLILVLAWTIGDLCKDGLQTGDWVISQLDPSPRWVPAITFVVSAFIALATGSSFSTMAIVIPIAAPMAWALTGSDSGLDAAAVAGIRFGTLSAVLGGAVFGDHCSPISDTTIMSSMSAASDHIDHVRTQAPYAATCGAVALLIGYIPSGYGLSPWITLPLGGAALVAVLYFFGRRAEAPDGDIST